MKRIVTFCLLLFGVAMTACSEKNTLDDYTLRVLTFEDNHYKGAAGVSDYWSSLIDSKQYEGSLLYGPFDPTTYTYGSVDYGWYDKGNTELSHKLPTNWGATCYAGGGHAISNYTSTDRATGNYDTQLELFAPVGRGGHNESRNFCVHNGFRDASGYSAEELPALLFEDGVARVIDHMWVRMTNYQLNALAGSTSADSFLRIVATGYDATGAKVAVEPTIDLERGGEMLVEWTRWPLHAMGKVVKVEFNIEGSYTNDYGLYAPAYFAYDDVAVRFE